MAVQFELQTDLNTIRSLSLEANFAECKKELTEMMAPYAGMVVTEDALPAAKADRAYVRSIAKKIDDTRKSVKRIYTTPLQQFEDKCKELTGICAAAAENIDEQVRVFEDSKKEQKQKELMSFYEAKVGAMREFLSWEDVFNPRWLNVTYALATAQEDIVSAIDECERDVEAIRSMDSEFVPALLSMYKDGHDIGACVRKHAELTLLRQQEEERKATERKEAEATRRLQEERLKPPYEPPSPVEKMESADVAESTAPEREEPTEKTVELDFRVYVTPTQMQLLRDFLRENNIKFTRVPKEER